MRASITLKNIDKSMAKLEKAAMSMPKICEKAVYDGAGPVADAFRSAISSVSTDYGGYTWAKSGYQPAAAAKGTGMVPVHGLTASQKKGLLDSMGISHLENKIDVIDKKIGVEGYNDTVTKKNPKGQPNAMILRSLESGSSWHDKCPVVRPTANKMRSKTKKTMETTIKTELAKITK